MKTVKILSYALVLCLVSMTTMLQAEDKKADQPKEKKMPKVETFKGTTLSCVMGCDKCSIFAKAIHESGLEDILAAAPACTLFVPDNTAFDKWSKECMDALFKCKAALSALVLNHVCPTNLSPEDMKAKMEKCCKMAQEHCEKIFGKENADKCAQFCKEMKEQKFSKRHLGEEGNKPDSEEAPMVKTCPNTIFKCDNGYVYVINKVQIPRALRVYKELKAAENAPVVIVETVEVTADAVAVPVPENGTESPTDGVKTPAESTPTADSPANPPSVLTPPSDGSTPPPASQNQ